MDVCVVGAGGIGSFYAARLLQAGISVTLIARGERRKQLQNHGLKVRFGDEFFESPVSVVGTEEWRSIDPRSVSFVFLATKSSATEEIAAFLSDWFGSLPADRTPPVLSLQNGVENERRLIAALGSERVIGGFAVRIGSHIRFDTMEATGPGEIRFGEWPSFSGALPDFYYRKLDELERLLNRTAIPCVRSSAILDELWRKLMINNGVNPITALLNLETGPILADEELAAVVHRMMEETLRAARTDPVRLDDSDVTEMYELIRRFDSIRTSMQIDLEKGQMPELDAITGTVIERCRRSGAQATVTRLLHCLLLSELRRRGGPVLEPELPAVVLADLLASDENSLIKSAAERLSRPYL